MRKRGFILPLVLLILALMSGIAVVLGRLSSEKTLSLKNQEGSYYAKEITVTLVESGAEEGEEESEGEEIETSELTSTSITLKKNKSETKKVKWKDITGGSYSISVKIESENDMDYSYSYTVKKGNKTEAITEIIEIENISAEDTDLTFKDISDDGTEINYIGTVVIEEDGKLEIQVTYTNTTDSNVTADITVILTEISKD